MLVALKEECSVGSSVVQLVDEMVQQLAGWMGKRLVVKKAGGKVGTKEFLKDVMSVGSWETVRDLMQVDSMDATWVVLKVNEMDDCSADLKVGLLALLAWNSVDKLAYHKAVEMDVQQVEKSARGRA